MNNAKAAARVIKINIFAGTGDTAGPAFDTLDILDKDFGRYFVVPLVYLRGADAQTGTQTATFPANRMIPYADMLVGKIHLKTVKPDFFD